MKENYYYLHKNSHTGEALYLEYDKIKGYPITPKTKIEDAIEVNKIIFVNPTLSEKLARKKVEIKIRYLLRMLEQFESDPTGGEEGAIQATLMDAERLKLTIINHYVKYFGNTYGSFSIKKIQTIINQLRIKLYNKVNQRQMLEQMNQLYYLDEEESQERKGRGR